VQVKKRFLPEEPLKGQVQGQRCLSAPGKGKKHFTEEKGI